MRTAARPVRLETVRRSKYRAIPTVIDGARFDSRLEARYYATLQLEQRAGFVREFRRQPNYLLEVNGVWVGRYVADYEVVRADGEIQVVDCKGFKTPVYRLKRRLFEALYPFRILEVTA
jgi:hypothetical protein